LRLVTSEADGGYIMTTEEIVKNIGILHIKINGDMMQIVLPNAWVKKNTTVIKANKTIIMEYVTKENARLKAKRETEWAIHKAEQDAIDNPLLDAMNKKADGLIASIPADHVRVTVEQIGDADGDPILKYTVDGIELNWRDIETVGIASAIRPGAMGAFAEERVCSISCEKLKEIKAAKVAAENKKLETNKVESERIAAIFEKAKETGKKQELKSYMVGCDGSVEECSFDCITAWAMPDGTTTKMRTHCY
jgi:hypothetical protein